MNKRHQTNKHNNDRHKNSRRNNNRHKNNHKPINDLYNQTHMTSTYVANKILELIKSDQTFLRINEK